MSKFNIDEFVNPFISEYRANFFQDFNGFSYCNLTTGGKESTYDVTSKQMTDLIRLHARRNKISFKKNGIEEIVCELDSRAFESDIKKETYVRVGVDKQTKYIYIDHRDDNGNITCITPNGYSTSQSCPINFIRTNKQRPIPLPISEDYKKFIDRFEALWNLKNKKYWILILTYILNALKQDSGSYVILILEGGQGQGKTTSSKHIKKLIDPTLPLLSSPPTNIEEISVMASSSHLLSIDNISGIDSKMADAFCMTSTGGGISRRILYTNNREIIYNIQKPVSINGIDEPTTRADFLDRAVAFEMALILPENRESEASIQEKFEESYPYLIGGIYSLLADVLKILPSITHKELPRMTDYARIGIAIEKALGLEDGLFLEVYNENINEKSENVFWNDELCSVIFHQLDENALYGDGEGLKGTSMELKKELFHSRGRERSISTPKTFKGFGSYLKRVEPILKTRGIVVERPQRSADARKIYIHFDDDTLKKYDKNRDNSFPDLSKFNENRIELDL